MSQHDMDIANQSRTAFRSDLNNALLALIGNSSGATEPATMFAYQFWADTTTGLLKQRTAANDAWITLGTMASAYLGLLPLTGGTLTGLLTTNGQVKFPTTQNPSGDPNTQDDYEEQLVVVGITFGGGAFGLSLYSNPMYVTKIGKMVFGHFFLWINSKGASTGNAVLTGLPYAEVVANSIAFDIAYWQNMSTSLIKIIGRINTQTIDLFGMTAAATTSTATPLTHSDFANNCIIAGSFQYTATA